jgi:hypothetical protein
VAKITALIAVIGLGAALAAHADNPILAEIEIEAASKIERDAGVWLDDQYVGFVKDLEGKGRLVTVPGEHTLRFRLIGHEEVERTVVLEPGEEKQYRLSMAELSDASYPDKAETARVRLDVEPETAAVFVNGKFVGGVDRFAGRGMRMSAGTYEFTIALPGYKAFETTMTVTSGQTYELKTELPRAGISDQASELTAGPVHED